MKRFFIRTFNKHAGTLGEFSDKLRQEIQEFGGLESLSVSENPNNKDIVFHLVCQKSVAGSKILNLFGIGSLSMVEAAMWDYVSSLNSCRVNMAQAFFLSGNRAVGVVVVEKEKIDGRTKRAKKENEKNSDQNSNASADSNSAGSSVD